MFKKTSNHLSLKAKGEIIDCIDKGVSFSRIAKQFCVGKGTVSRIKKSQQAIRDALSRQYNGPDKRKYLRKSEHPETEEKLYDWFIKQRAKHIGISANMLKDKAKSINQKVGGKPLNASNGWFLNFKKRYGIRRLKICGEKLSAEEVSVEPFKILLKEKMSSMNLTHDQLYNADETGLFWRLLPDKTFVAANEKNAPGRKTPKERVTFMACTNALGTHKLTPLVIGKAKTPRALKNIEIPVEYASSKKAWMNAFVFKNWFNNSFVKAVSCIISITLLFCKLLVV